ncbi:MAG: SufD family Fe-S cluster assembly protein [Enterobacteriaceae bacterium]|nr:SufD family Fe-S cluster assembly protein [Enterobacteriaceae bacterium]
MDKKIEHEFLYLKLNSYIDLYFNELYLKDLYFLEKTDFTSLSYLYEYENSVFNYKDYLHFNIPDNSQIVIFINGYHYSSVNLDINVKLSIFNSRSEYFDKILYKINSLYNLHNLNFFSILNYLLYKDGVYIYISPGLKIYRPLYILNFFCNFNSDSISNPRSYIYVDKNAEISIFEYYLNDNKKLFANINSFTHLNEGSILNYYSLNDFNNVSCISRSLLVKQEKHSVFNSSFFSFRECISKNNFDFYLLGDNSKLNINASKFLHGVSYNDTNVNVYSECCNVVCNIFFRSILKDDAKCIFKCNIDISSGLNKVVTNLRCDSLLLSSSSSSTMMPELSIKSSDVKCFHGATIGFIDDNIVYYMRTRGLSYKECLSIIINSFLFIFLDKKSDFFSVINDVILDKKFV